MQILSENAELEEIYKTAASAAVVETVRRECN
jgi:hypothetical protein